MCKINNREVDIKEIKWDYKNYSEDVAQAIDETSKDKDLEKILSSLASK